MSSEILLSIVIPTRGYSGGLAKLLRSIELQNFNGSFEVLVVANPPDPRVEACLKNYGFVGRYLGSLQKGANVARNLGVEHSEGEIVCFVDDDCVMTDERFLQRHRDGHARNPEVSALGGPYVLREGLCGASLTYHKKQMSWLKQGVSPRFGANYLLGGNCSFKRWVFERFRFNESLVFGGTETELFFRLKKAGLLLGYEPTLEVQHESELKSFSLIRKSFCQGIGAAFLETEFRGVGGGEQTRYFPRPERQSGVGAVYHFLYGFSHQAGSWFYKQTGCTRVSDWRIGLTLFGFFVRVWARRGCGSTWGRMRTCFYGAKGIFNKDG
jgi:glycosyltransferase involved in cell wall biosynthesis